MSVATLASPLAQRLLNDFQRGFPLVPRPFARIAAACGSDERTVIAGLRALMAGGLVGRVGAVFRPHAVGASTLAAIAVPQVDLERVAAQVNARPHVNHNYARSHAVNLWFVVTAPHAAALDAELAAIQADTGLPVLRMPLVEPYHIDLGFDLADPARHRVAGSGAGYAVAPARDGACQAGRAVLTEADHRLLHAIEDGLPLTPYPWRTVARTAGLPAAEARARVAAWQARGIVQRFGVIVRHAPLGFVANAMAVWDVPDDRVGAAGRRLATEPRVTLCYRRARTAGAWPFNLYCMVHGRDRAEVAAEVARIGQLHGLGGLPHAVLFREREFKQTGARYRSAVRGQPSAKAARP